MISSIPCSHGMIHDQVTDLVTWISPVADHEVGAYLGLQMIECILRRFGCLLTNSRVIIGRSSSRIGGILVQTKGDEGLQIMWRRVVIQFVRSRRPIANGCAEPPHGSRD